MCTYYSTYVAPQDIRVGDELCSLTLLFDGGSGRRKLSYSIEQ